MQRIRKKTFFSTFVAAVLLFTALPFSALHHHEDHLHNELGLHLSTNDADCPLCDFEFLPAPITTKTFIPNINFDFLDFSEKPAFQPYSTPQAQLTLRGPPSLFG